MGNTETSWLKRGCFGCLILVGLAAVILVALVAVPFFWEAPEPEPVEQQLTRELPILPEAGPAAELPPVEGVEVPEEPRPSAGGVEVVLDLDMGRFEIEPAPAGEPLSVEAHYDAAAFELSEAWDETARRYTVSFEQRRWMPLWRAGRSGEANEVVLRIPRGYPVALVGAIGVGQSRLELGGLTVSAVELDLGTGDHELSFSEPTPEPVERITLDGGVGELEIRDLGNASPAMVRVEQRIGELDVDLSGAWRTGGTVHLDLGIGECHVGVPLGIGVKLRRATVQVGDVRVGPEVERAPPEGAPVIELDVSTRIGEVRID